MAKKIENDSAGCRRGVINTGRCGAITPWFSGVLDDAASGAVSRLMHGPRCDSQKRLNAGNRRDGYLAQDRLAAAFCRVCWFGDRKMICPRFTL